MIVPAGLSHERILFACLDWGSGHVARSVSLLKQLQEQGNELVISCSEDQKAVFSSYGISASYVLNNGFRFRFNGSGNFTTEMVRNAWRFVNWVKMDQKRTEQLVEQYGVSLVLSDHCYGFRSDKVSSIFITHQVFLPPKAGWIAQWAHRKWMKRFNGVWIMDDEQKRLAGMLSNPVPKSSYIGFYSRFQGQMGVTLPGKIVGIVSGPEPYSEQLFCWIVEKYGMEQLTLISPKVYSKIPDHVHVISDWKQADIEIMSAETIISRNGYSTLMDLQFLKKKAVLIPTPGQLEQEYLESLISEAK